MTHGGSKHVSLSKPGTAMPKNHDALDCVADLARMLDVVEARLAQTECAWRAHVARTRTMDGNPASRGAGHGFSDFGGPRRPKRPRNATPSTGRYTGDAARPQGPGGAMNGKRTHYTKKAAQRAISWGNKRRPD